MIIAITWPSPMGRGDCQPAGGGWLYALSPQTGGIPDPFLAVYGGSANAPSGSDSAWKSGLWFPTCHNPQSYLCPKDIMSKDWTLEPQGANGPGPTTSFPAMS